MRDEHRFGALRSVIQQPYHASLWHQVIEALNAWDVDDGELERSPHLSGEAKRSLEA